MTLLTLYARKELTTDSATREYRQVTRSNVFPGARDVVLYRDAAATDRVGRYLWTSPSKPDRRNRRIQHNSFTYALEWLADL